MNRILVVDDEQNMCVVLKMLFQDEGYSVITSTDGNKVIQMLESGEVIDLIISDLKMPDVDGMMLLDYLRETDRDIPVVLITAYGTIPDAVEAMKKGAVDFITKPFNTDLILHKVKQIFEVKNLESNRQLLVERALDDNIIFKSSQMKKIMEITKKVAMVSTPVLLTGESGTGKELIAKAIHARRSENEAREAKKPFARINCATIPESLFESELFGYQRGAFTGASKDYKGKIRAAEGGTLFLDEIGELPLTLQPKLLHLLEDKTFQPLGSNTIIRMDCQFVCATNRELEELIKQGIFRKDLYYRINALSITVPPLRNRKEDIQPLMDYFLDRYCKEMGKTVKLSESARRALDSYDWPGNIRELKNIIERLIVLAGRNSEIKLMDLPVEITEADTDSDNRSTVDRLAAAEREMILNTLRQTSWNVSKAADLLGIPRGNLRYRIQKYNLKTGE